MIELELVGVRVELPSNQPIVLLKEREGERFLSVLIGAVEATAIAFALQGVVTPRPMTHDLMRDLVAGLDVDVVRVTITELAESTFHAAITLRTDGREVSVSSRTSDAVALAVRTSSPIFAMEAVMEQAGIEIEDSDEEEVEEFREFLDSVTPEDFEQ